MTLKAERTKTARAAHSELEQQQKDAERSRFYYQNFADVAQKRTHTVHVYIHMKLCPPLGVSKKVPHKTEHTHVI